MNYVSSNKTCPDEMTSFVHFIEKYALQSTYEYEIQRVALKSLLKMVKNFSVRIYLISCFNYEVNHISRFK